MNHRSLVLLTALSLVLASTTWLAPHATGADPEAPQVKTVRLDRTLITPDRVTLAKGERLTFLNSREDIVKLIFRGKGDLSKNIGCTHPKDAPPGPPIKAIMGPDGKDMYLYVPPGPFTGVCTFAAGDYTFDMTTEIGMAEDEVPPQGQIFAK